MSTVTYAHTHLGHTHIQYFSFDTAVDAVAVAVVAAVVEVLGNLLLMLLSFCYQTSLLGLKLMKHLPFHHTRQHSSVK